MSRFRPFPDVSSRYGAPTGRASTLSMLSVWFTNAAPDNAHLCVAGPAGEYDAGGAYWGYSGTEGPVWAVWLRGWGHDGVAYVRAKSRDGAKQAVIDQAMKG